MWKYLTIISLLLLSACSSTHLHLFTSGISQETQAQLVTSLTTAGFKTHLVEQPLPPLKPGSYLITTPSSKLNQQEQTIEHVLYSLNLPTPESRLFSLGEGISAHSYTKGNIGLYVIASEKKLTTKIKTAAKPLSILEWELGSVDCKKNYILDFMGDGKSIFSNLEDGTEIATLRWKLQDKQLILRKSFKRYIYSISEEQETLLPVKKYSEPYGCQFRSNYDSVVHFKQYQE